MPRPFTKENAAEMARLSHLNRKPKAATINPQPETPATLECVDPFAVELERAMEETLKELREADNAKDRAACAQALRNLRETYHMVTGLARPGVSKTGSVKPRRQMASIEPEPIPTETVKPADTGL